MAKVFEGSASDRLELGWAALGEANWGSARDLFEQALARDEVPEGFEGLSWAAWWLDDADAVFAARERAYRLYRQGGDPASAARMATWLACDELDFRGAVAVARGWLARAHRLLDSLEPRPEHGWLAFLKGYLAYVGGQATSVIPLGRSAAEIGRRFGVPDLEMLGLALEGTSLVASAHVDEGMRCLDEATTTALKEDAEVPISGAWACCFLVSACAAVRDYERAFEWCDRIADFAERYGSRYMLAFCRAEYGSVHLWRGSWTEAEEVLEASAEDFAHSRPAMAGGPLVALAELRRRQGRLREAAALLDRAGVSGASQLCRARLSLGHGDGARAVELAERALRQVPTHLQVQRAPALELLVEAYTVAGRLREAGSVLEALREIERRVGTNALRAHVDLAAGRLAAAREDHERARPLLEDAVDRFDRSRGPFEAALARTELAKTLLALGRGDDSEREAAAAQQQLDALGVELRADEAQRLREEAFRSGVAGAPLSELTPRQREVLLLLAEGLTNRQIAERLVVSEHTVHRHVTSILRKLDLSSRTAAAAVAARAGVTADRDG